MSCLFSFNTNFLPLLFFLCFITTSGVVTATKRSAENDHLALLDIKSKIYGGGREYKGLLESWNDSIHHCNWEGVTCGLRHKRVTVLDLGSQGLFGLLSPSIGQFPSSIYNLSLLEKLSFGDSPIHGSLPPNLGLALPHLQGLQVINTQMEGPIPTSLSNLSDIEYIELEKNKFSGIIRIDGQNLPKLHRLSLSTNLLGSSGAGDLDFLHSLVNCSNLFVIDLTQNQLGGVLPSSVANLSKNLVILNLSSNLISGNIPPDLGKLVNLQLLALKENRISGNIPNDIGNLKNLQGMYLYENDFSGSIPTSLGNLSRLIAVSMYDNQLQGAIPPSLGELPRLEGLDLMRNKLTGEIPPQFFNASSLSYSLSLGGNQLRGTLPIEIGQLRHLALLDISDNILSGNIPQSLGDCNSLTKLYMDGNSFTGSIPKSLSSLKGLLTLNLSRNNLSGQIPSYLSNFALVSLDLSFNNFEGDVPMKGIFTNASAVSLEGNKRLCGGIRQLHLPACPDTTQPKEKKKMLLIILLPSISSLLVGATVVLLLIKFCPRSKRKNNSSAQSQEGASNFLRVSYNMLLEATEGFSSRNLIGMGGFGSVYTGILNIDGKTTSIATKVLNLQHQGSAESFMRECEALRNIRHRNLVGTISACSSIDFQGNDFKALVYELMPKGNLDRWLHSNSVVDNRQVNEIQSSGHQSLNLFQRINIAIDVACALEYLHHDCETRIVHCDIKPSNILLDNDMVAHVGDFGLARLLPKEIISQSLSSAGGLQGTIGYAPPEYGLGNQISTRGDVYSYGIVLLEMMTAKKPTDQMLQNTLSLHDYPRMAVPDNVMEILDSKLLEADETIADIQRYRQVGDVRKLESLVSVIKVGVDCSLESPQERMNIKDVVRELKAAKDVLMGTRRV